MKPRQLLETWVAAEFQTARMTCIVENLFEVGHWDKLSFLRMHGLPLPQS